MSSRSASLTANPPIGLDGRYDWRRFVFGLPNPPGRVNLSTQPTQDKAVNVSPDPPVAVSIDPLDASRLVPAFSA